MENQDQTMPAMPTPAVAPSAPAAPTTAAPQTAEATEKPQTTIPKASNDVFVRKIVEKIKSSENILVALSRDPSVDEIAAAIGLTLFLDSLQKHTTAIYSGATPDALQFLQPEGTFETNTDSLRDFIIALNKEKADHLRYKLDGDFVKVFITPYKSNITEEDLEFSHGDFNVNLVLALGVPSLTDLDAALAEHGRIMHDATTVDITIDVPGKFGEIEWSDPMSSSVSEMVTKLIFALQGNDAALDKETATALLTGIVAATARFSNERTNSNTMQLASKLMAMGADQQLISAHVLENDSGAYYNAMPRMDLEISHGAYIDNGPAIAMDGAVVMPAMTQEAEPSAEDVKTEEAPTEETKAETETEPKGPSHAELAAAASAAVNEAVAQAAANAAAAGAESPKAEDAKPAEEPKAEEATETGKSAKIISGPVANQMAQQPALQGRMMNPIMTTGAQKDYAQMLEQALTEPGVNTAMGSAEMAGMNFAVPNVGTGTETMNPAAQVAPAEVNHGPEPVAKPSGVTLPPPPTPVVAADMMPPAMPKPAAEAPKKDAFQIPGAN